MGAIGLDLGGEFTRITVLDAVGELLEEGILRSTEAGFRQRFASMPPSLIGVQFDRQCAHLLTLLSGLGHTLLLSGQVPGFLRPALLPAVQRFAEQGRRLDTAPRTLLLRKTDGDQGMMFLLDVDPAVSDAWYFIGPIAPGANLASPELMAFEAAAHASSLEQARRLHSLWVMGEVTPLRPDYRVAA